MDCPILIVRYRNGTNYLDLDIILYTSLYLLVVSIDTICVKGLHLPDPIEKEYRIGCNDLYYIG